MSQKATSALSSTKVRTVIALMLSILVTVYWLHRPMQSPSKIAEADVPETMLVQNPSSALPVSGEVIEHFQHLADNTPLTKATHAIHQPYHPYENNIAHTFAQAASETGLSRPLVYKVADIFNWQINFARDIHQGDHFKVLSMTSPKNGKEVIAAASITTGDKTFTAIRFQDPTGHIAYYTPDGDSLKKALIRKPVSPAYVSSNFARKRYHPILGYYRSHLGVDWAAVQGTKIHVAGDGVVTRVGRYGGYGNMVMVKNSLKYTTVYAHMLRFARHLHKGQHVKQGEVIGYVGQTGLATGPHLHYEIRVFGVAQNPLKVTLPSAHPVAKKFRAQFTKTEAPLLEALQA